MTAPKRRKPSRKATPLNCGGRKYDKVRRVGKARPLYMWKFLIPHGDWRPLPGQESVEVSGALAVAVARNEAGARRALEKFGAENGVESRWLAVAKVIRIPIRAGAVGGYAMS